MIYVSSSPKSHNISKCSTSRCSRTSPSLSLTRFLPPFHLRCHKDTSAETSSFRSAGELCLLGTYLITLCCLMTRNTHTPTTWLQGDDLCKCWMEQTDGKQIKKKKWCSCNLSILNPLLINYYKARHNHFLYFCGCCAWGHTMRCSVYFHKGYSFSLLFISIFLYYNLFLYF